MDMPTTSLSMEQQFKLQVLREEVKRLSQDQAQEYLLEVMRQNMVKENLFKALDEEYVNPSSISSQKSVACICKKYDRLTSCTIVKNRQDACSTKSEFSCGTGILPVPKKLIENGATSQIELLILKSSRTGKMPVPQRVNFLVEQASCLFLKSLLRMVQHLRSSF